MTYPQVAPLLRYAPQQFLIVSRKVAVAAGVDFPFAGKRWHFAQGAHRDLYIRRAHRRLLHRELCGDSGRRDLIAARRGRYSINGKNRSFRHKCGRIAWLVDDVPSASRSPRFRRVTSPAWVAVGGRRVIISSVIRARIAGVITIRIVIRIGSDPPRAVAIGIGIAPPIWPAKTPPKSPSIPVARIAPVTTSPAVISASTVVAATSTVVATSVIAAVVVSASIAVATATVESSPTEGASPRENLRLPLRDHLAGQMWSLVSKRRQ